MVWVFRATGLLMAAIKKDIEDSIIDYVILV